MSEGGSRFCSACGASIGDAARFCPSCGTEQVASQQQGQPTEAQPDSPPPVRTCQRCGFETMTGAFNCLQCGRRLPEVSYSTSTDARPIEVPSTVDVPSSLEGNVTDEGFAPAPSVNRIVEGGWWGVLVILLVPIVIGVLAISFLSGSGASSKQSTAVPSQGPIAQPEMPTEADIVSECDIAVQNALVSESSYSPAWGWKYKVFGNEARVLRKYEAQNGFGAKISATYNCKFDTSSKQITSLQTIDAYGLHTLIKRK